LRLLTSALPSIYRRLKMLQDWYEQGAPPTFWLSGFFFVQSFLTAGLQNYARKQKIPIDMVGYDFEMMDIDHDKYKKAPSEGVYVHGMFLEGCGWSSSSKKLCESEPKVLFVPAPMIWLRPKPTDQFSQFQHYPCPVYRTAERKGVLATTGHSTNFVMMVNLPTDQSASHWILRGVCMLSQLSY
jgi:dynein heavy chain